jgi:hypothetical protein
MHERSGGLGVGVAPEAHAGLIHGQPGGLPPVLPQVVQGIERARDCIGHVSLVSAVQRGMDFPYPVSRRLCLAIRASRDWAMSDILAGSMAQLVVGGRSG